MYDKAGRISPSAFIPFCDFGGGENISTMGDIMGNYDLPVCKAFKPAIIGDQLCYELDLEKYKDKKNIENDLKSGLVFFMDYNEDRQLLFKTDVVQKHKTKFIEKVDATMDDFKAFVHLNTIGNRRTFI